MIIEDSQVAVIDSIRTPFMKAPGGVSMDMTAYDLARTVLNALKHRNTSLVEQCDQVSLGSVIQNAATSNIAREALIGAGLNLNTPAYSVTMACISANRAITNTASAIQSGYAKIAIAGGVDSSSDSPVKISHQLKKTLLKAQKAKSIKDYWSVIKHFKFNSLKPQAPAIAEFSTGLSMGQDADRLAAKFNISRSDQDQYALRSHQLATKAWENNIFENQVCTLHIPPEFKTITQDNTFYANTSLEKLSSLKPVFERPHGTVTAGNASPITDGASANLLMNLAEARKHKLKPQVVIAGYTYSAQNPDGELLLGPAYTLPQLLTEAGLSIKDIDVFEIHEAFAGQVLANLAAMADKDFCINRLGLDDTFGEIPMDKINIYGGSLSLGHPFGATGGRLLAMATHRLIESGKQFAVISACAAGGLGNSILLKNIG